jgi:hypothetical protein
MVSAKGRQSKLKKTHVQDQKRLVRDRNTKQVSESRNKSQRVISRRQCPDCQCFITNENDHVC